MSGMRERGCGPRPSGSRIASTANAEQNRTVCTNYKPVTLQDRLLANFGVARPEGEDPPEFTLPGFMSPFIVRPQHKQDLMREGRIGQFGLLPEWAQDLAFGRKTYNCRTETMKEKPAFKAAWFAGRRCVIPAEWLYEFNHESGDPVRWCIKLAHGGPMGVAGLWGIWFDLGGNEILSFTMLTVNADGHGVFARMHPPHDEKRMPVILRPEDYDGWLNCPVEAAEQYIARFPAELLQTFPEPAPWKALPEPESWSAMPDMFEGEWREASEDQTARQLKARRNRPKPKPKPAEPPDEGAISGELF